MSHGMHEVVGVSQLPVSQPFPITRTVRGIGPGHNGYSNGVPVIVAGIRGIKRFDWWEPDLSVEVRQHQAFDC